MSTTVTDQKKLARILVNSICDIEVKQRVHSIISRLSEDYWLSKDLTSYAESNQSKSNWFDLISFLNWYAHNFKPKNYLEVGVRRGRSMAQVLVESPETEAYGFDMWIPEYAGQSNPGPEFVVSELQRLGVSKRPTLIKGNSHETLPLFFDNPDNPQEFDLINIDGDHTYLGAKLDLDVAFAHLAPGGVLVFDDTYHHAHPELNILWREYQEKYKDCIFVEDSYGTGTSLLFKPPFTKIFEYIDSNSDKFNDEKQTHEKLIVKSLDDSGMTVSILKYKTVQAKVEAIEGFMMPGQEEYLFNKVSSLSDDAVIVEVGSFKGRSTVAMAYACIGTNRKIYSIDTWDGNDSDFPDRNFFEIWKKNVKDNNLLDYVVPLQGYSHDILSRWNELVENQKIDFIFIDGSHQYLDVLKDFELSFPLIKEDGWIAFHDVIQTWPGPERVWHNIAKLYLINHEYSSTLACGQKNSNLGLSNTSLELPIHFFTIVLNGEPFIRYHIDVFKQLSCQWHWHIIEGVADLKHDTAWSVQNGGLVTDEIHKNGRSADGTSEYLDELAQLYPENITVYRKPEGAFWEGKREMVNAPLPNIQEECLLWQVDVDELWTVEQINTTRQLFITHPEKTAAFYWCWYFVGEDLIISTRNCYAENPQQDWLRTWRFKPGAFWAAHEPPVLVESIGEGQQQNVAAVNPFLHAETEKQGLIFQHFAYVTPEQLKFKEQYYGYQNAVNLWNTLQSETNFPVYLRQYFPWVQDQTMVDKAKSRGITPIAQKDTTANWKFIQPASAIDFKAERKLPTILVDGVFFQMYKTGIARVWRSLLEEWAKNEFSPHIVVLDRVGTAPKIPGIFYRTIPAYDYNQTEADRELLQQICDEEGADLFISTYYTTPISTPSVFMAYDMIPEVLGADFNEPMWREKHHAIRHASGYISISENTASDLVKC
ncbi:MAG: class I SAM-dependent methyltransferase, partial [Limnoraphis sp.]